MAGSSSSIRSPSISIPDRIHVADNSSVVAGLASTRPSSGGRRTKGVVGPRTHETPAGQSYSPPQTTSADPVQAAAASRKESVASLGGGGRTTSTPFSPTRSHAVDEPSSPITARTVPMRSPASPDGAPGGGNRSRPFLSCSAASISSSVGDRQESVTGLYAAPSSAGVPAVAPPHSATSPPDHTIEGGVRGLRGEGAPIDHVQLSRASSLGSGWLSVSVSTVSVGGVGVVGSGSPRTSTSMSSALSRLVVRATAKPARRTNAAAAATMIGRTRRRVVSSVASSTAGS